VLSDGSVSCLKSARTEQRECARTGAEKMMDDSAAETEQYRGELDHPAVFAWRQVGSPFPTAPRARVCWIDPDLTH